jgi:hypothetical protein
MIASSGTEIYSLRNASLLLINLFSHPDWNLEAKEVFILGMLRGIVGYFENSKLAYKETF